MTVATVARDEAMAQVDYAADEYWKEAQEIVVLDICKDLGFAGKFTTDLVWKYLEDLFPEATTHEKRAMGPAMARMARKKLICATDEWRESEREECHARPVRVWKVQTFSH